MGCHCERSEAISWDCRVPRIKCGVLAMTALFFRLPAGTALAKAGIWNLGFIVSHLPPEGRYSQHPRL